MSKNSVDPRRGLKKQGISWGVLCVAIIISFTLGNRLQFIGDWFFAPYTNSSNATLNRNLDFAAVEEVYDLLKQKYDGSLDVTTLQDGLKRGLVEAAGDPYTVYLTPSEAAELQADIDGSFSGIGAELVKEKGFITIVTPLTGSPAEKAGLKARDVIIRINSEDATKLTINEAIKKIRGPLDSTVTLTILRGDAQHEVKVVRQQITVPSVESELLENGTIGYIRLTRFDNETAAEARKAASGFADKKVKGVIVDLRNNGGGLLSSSVDVASIWLSHKTVVEERREGKVVAQLKTTDTPVLNGVPTIVLINGGSASASEIVAGALRDHNAARLLGETTFGKGSVQEILDLPNGGKLKVTVARWFTPKGKNIDKEGIAPDIKVILSDADYKNKKDPQKESAIKELRR